MRNREAGTDPAAADPLSRLIEALGRRGWVGDRELIDDLACLASATPATLTALTVELNDLGEALDQSVASVAYLDLDTATVWPAELFDMGEEPDDFDPDDEQRWLPVPGQGAGAGYAAMEDFITTVTDPRLAGRLRDAIAGTGAFRRFHDELSRNDDEYTRWHRSRRPPSRTSSSLARRTRLPIHPLNRLWRLARALIVLDGAMVVEAEWKPWLLISDSGSWLGRAADGWVVARLGGGVALVDSDACALLPLLERNWAVAQLEIMDDEQRAPDLGPLPLAPLLCCSCCVPGQPQVMPQLFPI